MLFLTISFIIIRFDFKPKKADFLSDCDEEMQLWSMADTSLLLQ